MLQDEVRLRRQDAAQEPIVLDRVGGRAADDVDAVVAQVVDGLLLGGVEVAGRHEVGAAAAQDHEQGRGLGLEMDPGADPEPLEGLCAVELLARRLEQPRAVGDPLEARHQRRMNPMTMATTPAMTIAPPIWVWRRRICIATDAPVLESSDRRPPRHAS